MANDEKMISSEDNNQPENIVGNRFFTRRGFITGIVGGLASLGLAGFAGYELAHTGKDLSLTAADLNELALERVFVTRPDLNPPKITFTRFFSDESRVFETIGPRFIFVTPRTILQLFRQLGTDLVPKQVNSPLSQPGLMILDGFGRLVYFKPLPNGNPFDLNVQIDMGQPRLTWWQGQIFNGHGLGVGKIADSSYRTIDTIQAGNGLQEDCHELTLTGNGTALISAYAETTTDLSIVGGSRRAKVYSGHVQEIDLSTGKVLFDWDSLKHVGVEESYEARPSSNNEPYDYFHVNSAKEAPDGNLLIGARNTWAVYKVDRLTGQVIWRLNGKKSDFTMGPGTNFFWQHDVRMPGKSIMTVYDDGSYPPQEKQARGLLLTVNTDTMHVTLKREYLHPAGFLSATQGSMELMPDGRVLVGWGNQGYFTEFAPDGTMIFDAQFPPRVCSYRAFTHEWVGRPSELPSALVRVNSSGGSMVYVSWNGATEVANWSVLAGKNRSSLQKVGSQQWTGFETAIAVNTVGPYFCTVALDKHGEELGRSNVVKLDSSTVA